MPLQGAALQQKNVPLGGLKHGPTVALIRIRVIHTRRRNQCRSRGQSADVSVQSEILKLDLVCNVPGETMNPEIQPSQAFSKNDHINNLRLEDQWPRDFVGTSGRQDSSALSPDPGGTKNISVPDGEQQPLKVG